MRASRRSFKPITKELPTPWTQKDVVAEWPRKVTCTSEVWPTMGILPVMLAAPPLSTRRTSIPSWSAWLRDMKQQVAPVSSRAVMGCPLIVQPTCKPFVREGVDGGCSSPNSKVGKTRLQASTHLWRSRASMPRMGMAGDITTSAGCSYRPNWHWSGSRTLPWMTCGSSRDKSSEYKGSKWCTRPIDEISKDNETLLKHSAASELCHDPNE
ncbi:hypothetical protein E2C01_071628 [Portunus trituberculatus]|uniref:Uncharacterized protein n=1 Tax=Portunus trituberculatus TaxID=210409 RepID=A0A5B7HXH5_PORTR|nr:hypothetical protein [Portunus trituberculatus]